MARLFGFHYSSSFTHLRRLFSEETLVLLVMDVSRQFLSTCATRHVFRLVSNKAKPITTGAVK